MKKLINFTLIAIVCMATACHKDAALTYLKPVVFDSQFKASTTSVTLSAATDSSQVMSFSWSAAVYPVKLKVTYTLQVDISTDTTGASGWANATNLLIGQDVFTKSFKGAELNAMALKLGLAPNTPGTLVFRIKAYQDRNAYSPAITVAVTPWKIIIVSHGWATVSVPGDYQGWSPPTAPLLAAEQPGIYEGFIYEPAGGSYHFKFTSAPDWNHINYGDGGSGKLSTDGKAGDLVLPGPGYYELVCNTNNLTWSYTLMTWAIIGDATPGGWGADTQMAYTPSTGVWTLTANMVSTGSFKFRANNAWSIDFGINPTDNNIYYADNPAYPYNNSLNNLSVPSSGNYTITLDLRNPNNYNITLHKN
jgi:hypothetical protein